MTRTSKIMIVEDDSAIREELVLLLENEGYQVFMVTNFATITDQAIREHPDLILLDIGLPGQDGFARNPASAGRTVELTRNEMQIMVCLMEHTGQIVSRADLLDAPCGSGDDQRGIRCACCPTGLPGICRELGTRNQDPYYRGTARLPSGRGGITAEKLDSEPAQIEAHVERALFYARAESPAQEKS